MERRKAAKAKLVHQNSDDVVAWVTNNFFIPETNSPMPLAPYQQAALREALSRGADGKYRYSTVIWSDLKKTAKTTLAGAVACYIAFRKPSARIRLVGNDLKQADSRVFNAITEAIRLNPAWRNSIEVKAHTIVFPNGSRIESVPVDPKGEAGGNDDFVEFTELWAATTSAHLKMWTEMTLSPTKFGEAIQWIDTYAGFSGESEILERLYNQTVKGGTRLDLGIDGLEAFASGRVFALWNTQPRLAWLTQDYYRQQESVLPANEFLRLHRNQWVSSSQTFVTHEWWDSCRIDKLPALDRHTPIVIALDASVSGDCFGLVAVSLRQETRGDKTANVIAPRIVRKWIPPRDGKLDYDSDIEPTLKKIISEHNVVEICYDPYQLHEFCTRLARETGAHFAEFSQGTDRLIADKQLYDLIRDRCIEHDGNADLSEHIYNANSKSENERLRIVKRAESLKIDLAVCLSMAGARAIDLMALDSVEIIPNPFFR